MSSSWLLCRAPDADLFPWRCVVAEERSNGVEDGAELSIVALLAPIETVEGPHDPCSVNARGRFRVPPQLDLPKWNLKFSNSSVDQQNGLLDLLSGDQCVATCHAEAL